MPKPSTEQQLLVESQKEYQALEKLLAPLTPEQMTQPGAVGDWSVKDVLAHLYEWQQMFFGWYEAGLRGETPALPGRGYKWNQLPALNHEIYLAYRDAPLDDVLARFHDSHRRTMALVEALSEEDLFAHGGFEWLGKHSLAVFINANTGSHYRWARTELRKALNLRKKESA
jgi:uncharacterized protein (TIGR03083 family)